ncbi:MAG: phosphoglycerate dehydrogenase, partial [Aggregatilineales bacterium]
CDIGAIEMQPLSTVANLTIADVIVDEALLSYAPNIKVIARMSTGLSGVDIETASKRGIIVMNTPGVSSIAAGEHTLTLMLALCRGLTAAHNSLKAGYWLLDRKQQAGTQLHGKTLGLIGLGRVGMIVAERCLAFGMRVLAFDPYLQESDISDRRIQLVGLRDLLTDSDFISLHVPLTAETKTLINPGTISQMKQGVRLINTSNGSVLDENAVATAIKEGQIVGVAVDVFAEEPPYNSPLIGLNNVIHTPHIGDNTIEATENLSRQVVEQVLDALRDVDYRNVVNMPLRAGMDYEQVRPYLQLAEQIGVLQYTLARNPVRRVAVEVRGEELDGLLKPITVGILQGMIAPSRDDAVSTINAPILADEMGWYITQAKELAAGHYSNTVTCQVTLADSETITITGTLLDRKEPHIVQINQYRMNFVPGGHMLMIGSYDKPGVIGQLGTMLSEHGVNIASWHTGRAEQGGHTLTMLTMDEAIPDDVYEALSALDFIRHAHRLYINSGEDARVYDRFAISDYTP